MFVVFILSALWWIRIRGLWKLPDGGDWLWGKLGLVLLGGAMLSKSLIQFSVDGQGCVLSFLLGLRPNYGGVMANSFKRTCAGTLVFSAPDPTAGHCRPMPPSETPGHSQVSLAQSLLGILLLLLGHGEHKVLFVPSKSLFPQSCRSSVIKSHWLPVKFPGGSQSLHQIHRLGNLLWVLELS